MPPLSAAGPVDSLEGQRGEVVEPDADVRVVRAEHLFAIR
jgi:hypothetical protein